MTDVQVSGATYAKTYENYDHTWNTPGEWWNWICRTLKTGNVFDPCPKHWQPGDPDGLERDWGLDTYCNHPGERGSTAIWWAKAMAEQKRYRDRMGLIWCMFNIEQLRYMDPSPFDLRGYLVMPKERIGFVWAGPDLFYPKEHKKAGEIRRKHGEVAASPGNWTAFYSSELPASTPVECKIVRMAR